MPSLLRTHNSEGPCRSNGKMLVEMGLATSNQLPLVVLILLTVREKSWRRTNIGSKSTTISESEALARATMLWNIAVPMNLQRHDDVVAHMLQLQKVFPLSVPMACNNICLPMKFVFWPMKAFGFAPWFIDLMPL
jgi:hypothetical protein